MSKQDTNLGMGGSCSAHGPWTGLRCLKCFPEDTSLEQIDKMIASASQYPVNKVKLKQAILAWHTTQQAALLNRVREEVVGSKDDMHQDQVARVLNKVRAEQRIALDNLMEEMR